MKDKLYSGINLVYLLQPELFVVLPQTVSTALPIEPLISERLQDAGCMNENASESCTLLSQTAQERLSANSCE